jgi:hypothetical protein
MLPESYVIESNFYKTFLEKLTLLLQIKINKLSKSKDADSIGKVQLDLKFNKANLDIDIYDILDNAKGKKQVYLKAIFDRKNPYYDLKVKVENLNWSDKIYNLCSSNFFSKNFDINISFVALGNNFSDIIINKNFNIEFLFRNVNYVQLDKVDNLDISEIFGKDKLFDIKGNLSGYGQENNFRNLEIYNSDFNFKGYSSSNFSKGSGYQFSLYGNYNNKNLTYNIFEVGNRCYLKK